MKQKIQKETSCLDMSAESLVALRHPQVNKVTHEQIRWSNAIVNSPVMYGLIERRTLYFITGEVKHKFTEKNLGVPENWKDLYFHLTDEDLGLIGGQKNVPRTYEALSKLGEKFLPVSFRNEKGELIVGKVHWVDSFFYNTETGLYDVRVSPEIMPYLIDISRSFTTFDLGTAMLLRSKYSQKMYELCSQFCGDFRFFDRGEQAVGNVFKKRVVPIKMEDFRRIFNLDEIRDPRSKPLRWSYMNSIRPITLISGSTSKKGLGRDVAAKYRRFSSSSTPRSFPRRVMESRGRRATNLCHHLRSTWSLQST